MKNGNDIKMRVYEEYKMSNDMKNDVIIKNISP